MPTIAEIVGLSKCVISFKSNYLVGKEVRSRADFEARVPEFLFLIILSTFSFGISVVELDGVEDFVRSVALTGRGKGLVVCDFEFLGSSFC